MKSCEEARASALLGLKLLSGCKVMFLLAFPTNENASRPRSGPSENSPAIYRWGSVAKSKQSAKRTAESQAGIRENPSISAVRYTDCLINLDLIPALKVLGYSHIVREADDTYPFWAKEFPLPLGEGSSKNTRQTGSIKYNCASS